MAITILKSTLGGRKGTLFVLKGNRIGGASLLPKSSRSKIPKLLNKNKKVTAQGNVVGGLFRKSKTYKVLQSKTNKNLFKDPSSGVVFKKFKVIQ